MIIKNRKEILSHGNIHGRQLALDILDYAMEAIDAYGLTRKLVRIDKNLLRIGTLTYDLAEIENIYVLGAGKAVLQIAEALEDILGNRIKRGIVIEKKLEDMPRGLERIKKFTVIKVLQGAHPVPDDVALRGAKELLEIAQSAGQKDLVFFGAQGGCSSLTTLPVDNVSLEDIQQTTELLLKSGAEIEVFDVVRTAITKLNEGCLAKYIHPAEIINIVVNDYVWSRPEGDPVNRYDSAWGPSVPISDVNGRELKTVVALLKKHKLWDKLPESVKKHLRDQRSTPNILTVEDFTRIGIKQNTFVLADPQDGAEAALKGARELNLDAMILSSMIEGEASTVGVVFSGIAKEILKNARPLKPPCAVITAGEMTVTIVGEHGEGGRNQESVLAAAMKIDGGHDIVMASVGTDGTDGPTSIAGGIVDGYTLQRASEKGIDLFKCLKRHNSSYVLKELGDAIFFNEPGNNVCDLSLMIITD